MFKKIDLIIAIIAAMAVTSCAQMENIDTTEFGKETFTDWVQKHDPQATPIDKEGLVYRRFIQRAPQGADELKTGKYVYLKYTMSTMNGKYIISRDSLIARKTASWLKTTHWCDDYMEFYDQNGFFCPGIYDAINGLQTGDSLRIYVAATKAYTSNSIVANTGYISDKNLIYQTYPIICDIRIGEIVNNPAEAAIKRVDKFAAEKWGFTTKDSIKTGLYMRIVKAKPTGKEITTETAVPIYYKQTFTDGFLLATNNDSIAKVYNRYEETNATYDIINVTPKPGFGGYDTFYNYVLPKMKIGEVAEVITIPFYTVLGNTGSFYTAPQLLTYQPTVFTIITIDKTKI